MATAPTDGGPDPTGDVSLTPAHREAAAELRGVLYGGESIVGMTGVGDAVAAVTTHRVLVYDPGADEGRARFQAAPRLNVTGVEHDADGDAAAAGRAARYGLYAVVGLAAGLLIDLEGFVGPIDAPSGMGIGSVVGLINTMVRALALLDDLLVVGGLFALTVALLFLGQYLRSRERYLEVGVAGGEPIRVPVGRGGTGADERLEAALRKASNASTPTSG